jgi:cell division protein ZapE
MTGPVGRAYRKLVRDGELKPDAAQERAVAALDRLAGELNANGGLLRRFFARRGAHCSGVYLWGGVGRGKSMLMDLAFQHIDVAPKRRVHFHAFMLETHARLREARKSADGDPVHAVADRIAGEVELLCFDEMVVNNPADALILSRLF